MTFAIDLRSMGTALALVTLVAGCNTALKSDEPAGRSSSAGTATRSQPAPSAPGSMGSSSGPATPSRPAPSPSVALPAPPPPDPVPAPSALQIQLADAIRLFDAGDFYLAAGRLRNLPELNSASVETQLTAMKYLAFSYCVTNRRTLCQQQFEAALRVDPKFELAPAERGHPIWKVHFERAKQVVAAAPATKGGDAAAAKVGGEKKATPNKRAAAKGDAGTSETKPANTQAGAANKSDVKKSAGASKGNRKGGKDVSKGPAAPVIDSRPSPDQKPQ